ncbi:hypothetical protein GCM10027515_24500 [Schumannella luteola]|uniref:DUF2510 domain-containing protein n=1 Tax=Schumannella luteola TaxID=472059 RepID=A0A852YD66_9MICO|nr:DUF2510 domain-containing protein [Schumannella luteola]NYG99752.1 hypothetical protein [Schumannella luteola]TPX06530.1 DUF2510 domain-containing protein [Schumannella luteola]
MTDVASARPRAGWYDDPTDAAGLRWWDGIVWTDNAMPKPAGAPVAVPPPLGSAYSVDDQRAAASPRRAARMAARETARRESDAEPLARVTQLRPAADVIPSLGLVPDAVFAPEPVPVAVRPEPTPAEPAPLPSFDDFLAAAFPPAVDAAATPATASTPATPSIPQPGELVGGPAPGTAVLDAAATALPEPVALATPAPSSPVSAPPSPERTALPAPAPQTAAAAPLLAPRPAETRAPDRAEPTPASPGRELAPAAPAAGAQIATGAVVPTPGVDAPESTGAFVPDFAPDGRPIAPAPELRLPPEVQAVAAPAVATASPAPSRRADDWWRGLMPTGSVTTASVLLALTPVFSAVLPLALLGFAVELPEFAIVLLLLPVALIVPPVVLALVDRRRLRGMGWGAQASPAWVVLGPFVYLLARQFVLQRQGARTRAFTVTTVLMPLVAIATTGALLAMYRHDLLVWLLVLQVRLA